MKLCIISPYPPAIGGMANQAKMLVDSFKAEGVEVYPLPTNPKISMFIERIRFLRGIVKEVLFLINLLIIIRKTDIVCHFACSYLAFFLFTFPCIIVSKIFSKKIIISYRGGGAQPFFKKWGFVVKPLFKIVDGITVPSGYLKEKAFIKLGFDPVIIHSLVDLKRFEYRQRKNISPRLLVLRHLEKIYNIECALYAFQIIKKEFPQAKLTIVGGGSQEKYLQTLVKDLKLKDVEFIGKISYDDVWKFYQKADVFINPTNIDNMPGVILEAFASGIPVVSTNAGGIPYMVQDGFNGLLVPVGDYKGIAEKVILLLKNPALVYKITTNAKKDVENYSWDIIKEKWLKLFQKK